MRPQPLCVSSDVLFLSLPSFDFQEGVFLGHCSAKDAILVSNSIFSVIQLS